MVREIQEIIGKAVLSHVDIGKRLEDLPLCPADYSFRQVF